jgi:peptidylprolyl isomerase/peptidyl-prolyl cis-trans isomerase B (cyclophilin B)
MDGGASMKNLKALIAVTGLISLLAPVTGAAPAKKAARSVAKMMNVITMETTKGTIKFTLLPQYAPVHCEKFIALTKKKFYDGLTFHRVVPGFVIQGGDPSGNGSGGPGYTIKAEFSERKHLLGTVAMARTPDPDSAGSQFYICLDALPSLDRQYTTFGQVFEGIDIVQKIVAGDKMTKVTVAEVPVAKIPEAARN